MSFSQENGYIPQSFDEIMNLIRLNINSTFNTTYTEQTFIGTGWYKFYYRPVQKIAQLEVKTSEVFFKLQQYITQVNQRVQRPSVSIEGIIDSFKDNGFRVSVKEMEIGSAGTISICVDIEKPSPVTPEYEAKRLEICTLIKDFVSAGMITLGTESEDITISNGQQFTFKFFLPERLNIKYRVTINKSENNLLVIPDDEEIRAKIFNNINELYRMGWNFEPQRYFAICDAPWADSILAQYSIDNGVTWTGNVFDAEFDDLLIVNLEDIEVIIN